jgi:hypothetical protein
VSDQLTFEHATLAEADLLIAIHEEASRWLLARGIRQWKTGCVSCARTPDVASGARFCAGPKIR